MEEEMDDFFDKTDRFMRRHSSMLTPRLEGARGQPQHPFIS